MAVRLECIDKTEFKYCDGDCTYKSFMIMYFFHRMGQLIEIEISNDFFFLSTGIQSNQQQMFILGMINFPPLRICQTF
jgi:hypothetical protein